VPPPRRGRRYGGNEDDYLNGGPAVDSVCDGGAGANTIDNC
jgi:hypothetical protein